MRVFIFPVYLVGVECSLDVKVQVTFLVRFTFLETSKMRRKQYTVKLYVKIPVFQQIKEDERKRHVLIPV